MTGRGRFALALGALLYVAAWAFGSIPLYPVAVGLVLAVLGAWIWVRLIDRPMQLRRIGLHEERLEGQDVAVTLELLHDGRIKPFGAAVVERIERLGERRVTVRPAGDRLVARYELERVPRGRYPFEPAHAVLEDPFGLERRELELAVPDALLVYPRIVELPGLFSEAGTTAHGGRRVLLRRPSGFDLHSVREYTDGDSLRKVHWRSTAHRGQLMVKELEESPRDDVAVVLDCDAAGAVGERGDSSFDVQVRAAGSVLRAHTRGGRRAILVLNALGRPTQRVHGDEGDWRRALEVLAAAEPTADTQVADVIAGESGAAASALELAVVTARLAEPLVERLVQRAHSRRSTSLVYVDATSFATPPRRPAPEPALLRLQAAGVPVAVLRRGDDLLKKLGGLSLRQASHG
jgi:uncharacterized protein (DUF58 family)